MHIIRLEIENLPPLGDVEFDCDERVNLFIGPNGSGKSTILQSIHEMYFLSEDHFDPTDVALRTRGGQTLPYNEHLEFDNFEGQLAVLNLEASYDWRRCLNLTKWRLVPLRYIPAVRVNLRERQLLGILDGQSEIIRTRVSSVHFGIFCGQDVEAFIDSAREGLETSSQSTLESKG